MVRRFACAWILVVEFSLTGCDPFAPADPEKPSNSREAVVAVNPKDVEEEWGKAVSTRDMLLVSDIISDSLRMIQAGDTLKNVAFKNCIESDLFAPGGDSAVLVWQAEYVQETSAGGLGATVAARVDYTITRGGMPRVSGSARWTLSNANTLGWELVRWEDLAESKSGMFAYCQGGGR